MEKEALKNQEFVKEAEARGHAKSALLLSVFAVVIMLFSIFLAFEKADPRGVYIAAYEITADGERNHSDKNAEFHLKSGGVATYVNAVAIGEGQSVQLNGSWKKDGNKIILVFQGEKAVFRRSGNKLIETLEDGSKVVYIKD